MRLRADLHIHSCLSPCGDLSMSPRAIAERAARLGLSLIALTDHNTARNVPAFAAACRERGLAALYGCEVTSSEEAHVVALFDEPDVAVRFGDEMYASLPPLERDPERYGDQVVVDERETIVETLRSYLIGATSFPMNAIGRRIHELGGLFIPAHIDRSAFSVWSQLGFLPPDEYDAVEMVTPPPGLSPARGGTSAPRIDPLGYPVTVASDAHRPEDIGRRWIEFEADAPGVEGLRAAFREQRVDLCERPTQR
ncbi:MAG: PHP domain-containing protein [Spirochaetota bacterium]